MPQYSTREANTTVRVRNADTIVIGGLLESRRATAASGIPGLMDIPIVGEIFKTTTTQEVDTDLIIVVTPFIIGSALTPNAAPRAEQRTEPNAARATERSSAVKPALGAALLSLLIACAPALERPQFATGEGALLEGFRRDFAPVFDELAVSITGGAAYRYVGVNALALAAATDAFYLAHPGFCPVADGFFYLAERRRYVTFAAKDQQVAVFGYDLSMLPALSVVDLEGEAVKALPILPCRTAQGK